MDVVNYQGGAEPSVAWILVILAAAALVALAAVGGRKAINRERERLLLQQRHFNEREVAGRILTGQVEPLPAPGGIDLQPGEQAYFQAAASHLVPVNADEDEFERRSRGTLVVTDQALIYAPVNGAQTRMSMDSIGRIDLPLADILTVVTFADTFTREEQFWYFQLERPLLAAAHLSRFAGFQLVLGGDTMPALDGGGLPGDDQSVIDVGRGEKSW